jgi:hypothetical protein
MRAAISAANPEFAARVLSLVGLPPVLALPTALLAGVRAGGTIATLLSVLGFLISGCLLPTALTLYLVRCGRATALDLRERGERILPSTVTAVGCALASWCLSHTGAPRSISDLALAISIQMGLLALLTTRWKVSYHMASAGALVAVGRAAMPNPLITLALMLLAVSIGWARVHQQRHNLAQVVVGAATALPVAFLS